MNVRRLAAIDMYGLHGTTRRRRIVLAEFVFGVVVMVAVGVAILVAASGISGRLFGWWMTGAGLNYAPLAVHAITLSRPGELDRELSGIDPGPELRRYGVLQLWIFVPLSLVAWDVAQLRGPGNPEVATSDLRRLYDRGVANFLDAGSSCAMGVTA
jgi:hypothetical protein